MKHSLLDIAGIKVGQAENQTAMTGVTVILTENGAVCGVDVRGAAPGTRETDLLNPINTMEKVHAVVLSGGSAFGLDAAGGVMQYLEERNIGFDVGTTKVPIVPQAVLFDLTCGDPFVRPDRKMAYEACLQAQNACQIQEGSYGAGCGAHVGKLNGIENATKSGVGCESIQLFGGIVVAALVAVNASGDVWEDGKIIAGARKEDHSGFLNAEHAILFEDKLPHFRSGENTTIGVVATNARLTKAQATKIAAMAHDGLARSIRPAHTSVDGDTLFCLSTGELVLDEVPLDRIGTAAAYVMEKAVCRAVKAAWKENR